MASIHNGHVLAFLQHAANLARRRGDPLTASIMDDLYEAEWDVDMHVFLVQFEPPKNAQGLVLLH
jgi:hypothetical protein